MPAISSPGLRRAYGNVLAVDGLDLAVNEGEIFGLVGPDGAGKTTTMRMLTGILPPTAGVATVAGFDVVHQSERLKNHIGYMSQRFGLYPDLTVLENIAFYADIYGVPRRELAAQTERLLGFSNLTPFKKRLAGGEALDSILPEAYASVREAAKRTLGERHFDVKLLGGIVMHQGKIAEMKTGEGKTLTATLPIALYALAGKGSHLVTVNDYLARRDAGWMGPVFKFLGMTTSSIISEESFVFDHGHTNQNVNDFRLLHLKPVDRKEAYLADVVYGINSEFGFDYLRDNMVSSLAEMVQHGHYFAIVDEVDSILIDEARVPLIISGQAEDATEKYYTFAKVVLPLEKDLDYELDEKTKSVTFTDQGQNKIVKSLGFDPWLDNDIITTHQLPMATLSN